VVLKFKSDQVGLKIVSLKQTFSFFKVTALPHPVNSLLRKALGLVLICTSYLPFNFAPARSDGALVLQ
jgi:hypothetical protein